MNFNLIVQRLFLTIFFISVLSYSQPNFKFAVIGDYGEDNQAESDVADLINSWGVDLIVTVGDNYYGANDGNYADSWQALDDAVGKYFHNWIKPYLGSYGNGSPDSNRFFPSLGNHDWYHQDSSDVYTDYFDLAPYSDTSGNERYYDFVWGNVHFFILSTYGNGLTEYTFPRHGNYGEPDGVVENSIQAQWLQTRLENADPFHWKVVITHQAPYSSSSEHGSEPAVQWPYNQWGADIVLCGHDHVYERLFVDNLVYFVNGLGGGGIYNFGNPVSGSQFRYNEDYGAMLFEVYSDSLMCSFINRSGDIIDNYKLFFNSIPVELISFNAATDAISVTLSWRTASETNNSGFEIQRKNIDWERIAFVEGNGTTTEENNYSFIDENLTAGKYLYRLKQIDYDGSFELSDIVEVEILTPIEFSLSQNYPNPFNPETHITFKIPETTDVKISVYDFLGNEIAVLLNEKKSPGTYQIGLNLLSLSYEGKEMSSGIYFYKISTSKYSNVKKMVFLK